MIFLFHTKVGMLYFIVCVACGAAFSIVWYISWSLDCIMLGNVLIYALMVVAVVFCIIIVVGRIDKLSFHVFYSIDEVDFSNNDNNNIKSSMQRCKYRE